MNTFRDYSKIVLAILAVSSVSIPVASQAGGFNPAMRDGGHRGTAAVRPNRQYRGSAVRHQRRDYRSGVSVRSGRRHGYSRAYQSRPYVRYSGRYYARYNRPLYRYGYYPRYGGYYRAYYGHTIIVIMAVTRGMTGEVVIADMPGCFVSSTGLTPGPIRPRFLMA